MRFHSLRVVGARRRVALWPRRPARICRGRRSSHRHRTIPEPGLLVLPAGQCEPDPVFHAARRARAQFCCGLLGPARLEGHVRAARIYPAPIRLCPRDARIGRLYPADRRQRSRRRRRRRGLGDGGARAQDRSRRVRSGGPDRRRRGRHRRRVRAVARRRCLARALRSAHGRGRGAARRERRAHAAAQEHRPPPCAVGHWNGEAARFALPSGEGLSRAVLVQARAGPIRGGEGTLSRRQKG